MREENKFDDFIKQQLSDYSPEVPPNIWQNIEAENNKRRPAAFWWNLLNNRAAIITAIILLTAFIATFAWKFTIRKELAITKPVDQPTKNIISSTDKIPADSNGQLIANNKKTIVADKRDISPASTNSGDSNSFVGNTIFKKDKNIAGKPNGEFNKKEVADQYLANNNNPATVGGIATVPHKIFVVKTKAAKFSITGHTAKSNYQTAVEVNKIFKKKIKASQKSTYTIHTLNADFAVQEDIEGHATLNTADSIANEKLSAQLLFDVQFYY